MLSRSEKTIGAAGLLALSILCSSGSEGGNTPANTSSEHHRRTDIKKRNPSHQEPEKGSEDLAAIIKEYKACMEQPLEGISESIQLNVSCRERPLRDASKNEVAVESTCHAEDEKGRTVSYITSYLGEALVQDDPAVLPEGTTQVAYAGSFLYTTERLGRPYNVAYFPPNYNYQGAGDGNVLIESNVDEGFKRVRNVAHFETFPDGLRMEEALSMCNDARAYLAGVPTEDRVIELTAMVEDLAHGLGAEGADIEVMPATEPMSFLTQAGFLVNFEDGSILSCSANGFTMDSIDEARLECWRLEDKGPGADEANRVLKSFSPQSMDEIFHNPSAFLDFATGEE